MNSTENQYELRLLGSFELTDTQGEAIAVRGSREKALLALLALAGPSGRDRTWLSGLLWPDRPTERARKSLRQALVGLRQSVGTLVVPADRRQVVSIPVGHLSVDALGLASIGSDRAPLPPVEDALLLYRGELLCDVALESELFQEWVSAERTKYLDTACAAYARITESYDQTGDWNSAVRVAEHLLKIDPLRESSCRTLMRTLGAAGRLSEISRVFGRFSELLDQELGVRPDSETAALHELYRNGGGSRSTSADLKTEIHHGSAENMHRRPGLVVLPLTASAAGEAIDPLICEGLTEELIDALAAYRWFTVMSSFQSAAYRGSSRSPTEAGAELGVRYVVAGRIRAAGSNLTLRAEIIETGSGALLCSRRFTWGATKTQEMGSVVARQLAESIEPELLLQELRSTSTRAQAEDVWKTIVRARQLSHFEGTRRESLLEAMALAQSAVRSNPTCAFAQASVALAGMMATAQGFLTRREEIEQAMAAAEQAVELDPGYYLGHAALGFFNLRSWEHAAAVSCLRRAIDLNPSYTLAFNVLISCLTVMGRPHEAIDYFEPLQRVSPSDPIASYYDCTRGLAYYCVGDDEGALHHANLALSRTGEWLPSQFTRIAATQRIGSHREASRLVEQLLEKNPWVTATTVRRALRFRHAEHFSPLAGQLVAAGVPV